MTHPGTMDPSLRSAKWDLSLTVRTCFGLVDSRSKVLVIFYTVDSSI